MAQDFNKIQMKTVIKTIVFCVMFSCTNSGPTDKNTCYDLHQEHLNSDVVVLEAFYRNDKRYGVQSTYFDNGKIESLVRFVNDTLQGVFVNFYENGNIWEISNYSDNQLDGKRVVFFENNCLKQLEHYNNGLRHGVFIVYDSTGSVISHKEYKFDKLVR